jgi:hypothetical protein
MMTEFVLFPVVKRFAQRSPVAVLIPEDISAMAVPPGGQKFHSFLKYLYEFPLDPQATLFEDDLANIDSYLANPKGALKAFIELARRALPLTFLVLTFLRYGGPHCGNVPVRLRTERTVR